MGIVIISAGYVDKLSCLPFDDFNDFRMRVSKSCHCNTGIEIEKRVSIDVFEDCSVAALDDERIASRIAGGNKLGVAFQKLFCFRPRESSLYLRQRGLGNRLHGTSSMFETDKYAGARTCQIVLARRMMFSLRRGSCGSFEGRMSLCDSLGYLPLEC